MGKMTCHPKMDNIPFSLNGHIIIKVPFSMSYVNALYNIHYICHPKGNTCVSVKWDNTIAILDSCLHIRRYSITILTGNSQLPYKCHPKRDI